MSLRCWFFDVTLGRPTKIAERPAQEGAPVLELYFQSRHVEFNLRKSLEDRY